MLMFFSAVKWWSRFLYRPLWYLSLDSKFTPRSLNTHVVVHTCCAGMAGSWEVSSPDSQIVVVWTQVIILDYLTIAGNFVPETLPFFSLGFFSFFLVHTRLYLWVFLTLNQGEKYFWGGEIKPFLLVYAVNKLVYLSSQKPIWQVRKKVWFG